MITAYFKLRANVGLEGDIRIAERELRVVSSELYPVKKSNLSDAIALLGLDAHHYISNTRKGEIIGFIGYLTIDNLLSAVLHSSFTQEIWLSDKTNSIVEKLGSGYFHQKSDYTYCIVPLFAMAELLTYKKVNEVSLGDIEEFTQYLANDLTNTELNKIVIKSSTSTPHVHGLHKYKAKFFPRLVRSLLFAEAHGKGDVTVLDPFVGSGTALIEASFMGYDSTGIDIDKLSCLISESKSALLNLSPEKIKHDIQLYHNKLNIAETNYKFPSWISKKFDRWNNTDERAVYEAEISSLTNNLSNLNGTKALFETALSDAVSRKFNIRMMGTGVGRFALEIQKSSLNKIFDNNIKFFSKANSVVRALKEAYKIKLPNPRILNGSATALPIADNSIDIILTSPPYLPASSGREDYLIGKSISITALKLMSEEDINLAEQKSVGSMKNLSISDAKKFPKSIHKLYDFLNNDELRKIKANPTVAYYSDMQKSLEESLRVLSPGGRAIYIIGKESVFYTFKSREILYRVECDKIFEEMAIKAGFIVCDIIDIELDKKNKNARPRSLDKYYESAIILEKPVAKKIKRHRTK